MLILRLHFAIISGMNPENWHAKHRKSQSLSVRLALKFVAAMGTIQFIAVFNVVVISWVAFNTYALFLRHWDPYPFIALNLLFSWQASNAASFILIAQNDQTARDKIQAEHQYEHQEFELKTNTQITKEIHELTKTIHELLSTAPADSSKIEKS